MIEDEQNELETTRKRICTEPERIIRKKNKITMKERIPKIRSLLFKKGRTHKYNRVIKKQTKIYKKQVKKMARFEKIIYKNQ